MAQSAQASATDPPAYLVLQGGGALGAYQAGVYETLFQSGYAPEWIAGISIGAINAAIIAGNEPERRVERLHAFWDRVSEVFPFASPAQEGVVRRMYNEASAALVAANGIPGFFSPRFPPPFAHFPGTPGATSFYDTAPLHATLLELVDFDLLNSGEVRLSVGAVNVLTGNFAYFDTERQQLGPEHIMASAALPPGFPPVMIDGEPYWDGGLVSNTPLQYVLDTRAPGDASIFQVDLFSARGAMPQNLIEVYQREKDIRYSSRTRLNTDLERELVRLRNAATRMAAKLPPELRDDPDGRILAQCSEYGAVTVVHLINRDEGYEAQSKDYEFSRMSVNEHWASGLSDASKTLSHPQWLGRKRHETGLVTYDLDPSGKGHVSIRGANP
jgi:NTE family protein